MSIRYAMMQLLRLVLAIFALAAAPVCAIGHGETVTLKQDQEFYTKPGSSFSAYMSPWCALYFQTGMAHGTDYIDTVALRPSSFPNNSLISWRWPNRPPTLCGVYGYAALQFGNYDGGAPSVAVTPRQSKNITTLTEEVDLSIAGETANFNVLNEGYLTSTAGDANAKVIEIGYFLHAGTTGLAYHNSGTLVGTHIDGLGRAWTVRRHADGVAGDYVTLVRAGNVDMLKGPVIIGDLFSYLQAQGVIDGNGWLNGWGLGVEMNQGSGSLQVDRWTMIYK